MRLHFKVSALAIAAALLGTAPAVALSINLGGSDSGSLLGLGGGSSTTTVSADTSGLLNGGSGTVAIGTDLLGTGGTAATATVDLGGAGSGGVIDLLGNGSGTSTTADVNLGGSAGTNANLLLDLFGDGSSTPNARVDLGSADVVGTSGTANRDAVLNLFGPSAGSGTGGDTGTGVGSNGKASISAPAAEVTATASIAGIDTAGKGCFAPNAKQVAKLASRHPYVDSTFSSWTGVSQLKVVDIGLCQDSGTAISSQPNVGRLQAFVADHAALRDGLAKLGRKPAEVIAADKSGATLTVYVM